jgi:hypothetical protein
MSISVKNQQLFARQETTYGVYLAPAGADALQVFNLKYNPHEDLRAIEREIIRSSLNSEATLYGGALGGVEFDMELKGSGTAGTAPRFGRLLRACGFQETVVPATSVTYRPQSSLAAHEGVSMSFAYGGVLRTLRGCRGTVSLTVPTGMPGKLSFKMKGHINTDADAAPPAATYETTRPPAFLSATFTVGAYSCPIAELSIDPSNNVVPGQDPNTSSGYGDVRITNRKTKGKINPEAKLIATKDWIGIFREHCAGDLDWRDRLGCRQSLGDQCPARELHGRPVRRSRRAAHA